MSLLGEHMTGTHTTASDTAALDPIGAAQARLSAAYTAARRGVFDVLPVGAIEKGLLTCAQRRMLVELEAAERDLDQLRRAGHHRADDSADVEQAG